MERRVIQTELVAQEQQLESSLRPQLLDEYIGQEKIKSTIKIYIEAAKQRGESLDHVLFYGPPGLGKTTLSTIIANEMGVNLKITSGPAIEKPGDMAAILNSLQENDVLFVDEIHRLNRQVEEILYRHYDWKGSERKEYPPRFAKIYFNWSNNKGGAFNWTTKRPLWRSAKIRVLSS